MNYINYAYSLLSEGNLFFTHCNATTPVLEDLHLKYSVYEYDFLEQAKINYSKIDGKNNFSLYPLAVRYVSEDKNVYVIERPPFQIDVDFSTSNSYSYRTCPKYLNSIKMWIPWTVCVVSLDPKGHTFSSAFSFSIFFNDKPLSSFEEDLVPCFLPNSSSGNICMGQDSQHVIELIKDQAPIADIYNALFNSYFAGWNCDLSNMLPFSNYFYSNDIIDRILKTNKGPKNYNSLGGSRSSGKTYNQMLYLLSNLSLEELLDYIAHCKNGLGIVSQRRRETFPNHLSNISSLIQNQITKKFVTRDYNWSPYSNPTLIVDDSISNSFEYRSMTSVSARVVITNYSKENIELYSSNPYIIAKVYNHFYENKNNGLLHSNTSFNFDLTNEEVSPYFNTIQKELEDVVSS
jgi:hypothetical protein